jgi:hypothetical protein
MEDERKGEDTSHGSRLLSERRVLGFYSQLGSIAAAGGAME